MNYLQKCINLTDWAMKSPWLGTLTSTSAPVLLPGNDEAVSKGGEVLLGLLEESNYELVNKMGTDKISMSAATHPEHWTS